MIIDFGATLNGAAANTIEHDWDSHLFIDLEEVDSGKVPVEVLHDRLHELYAAARSRVQEGSKTPLMELLAEG